MSNDLFLSLATCISTHVHVGTGCGILSHGENDYYRTLYIDSPVFSPRREVVETRSREPGRSYISEDRK